MNMPGGTIRGGTLVVVEQMDQDGAVRREFVPDRRGVLEARIDELQRIIGDCDRSLDRIRGEGGQRGRRTSESNEQARSCDGGDIPTSSWCYRSVKFPFVPA